MNNPIPPTTTKLIRALSSLLRREEGVTADKLVEVMSATLRGDGPSNSKIEETLDLLFEHGRKSIAVEYIAAEFGKASGERFRDAWDFRYKYYRAVVEEKQRQLRLREEADLQATRARRELQNQQIRVSKIRSKLSLDFESACDANFFRGDEFDDFREAVVLEARHAFPSIVKNLNDEQVLAVCNLSGATILAARAGSGKTKVICTRAALLIDRLGHLPTEVAVLAFNTEAVREVKERIQQEFNIPTFTNSRTFHSLAMRIVNPTEEVLDGNKQELLVSDLVRSSLNPTFLESLHSHFRREVSEMESLGSLMSQEDFYTALRASREDTLNGERVKSKGEKWIADFLFEHGISYSYERLWFGVFDSMYKPDFSLMSNTDAPHVVIEHWGVDSSDRERKAPAHWVISWEDYVYEINEKKKAWDRHNINNPEQMVYLLETSIADLSSGRQDFENILRDKLLKAGVNVQKLTPEELHAKVARKKIPKFISMVSQFINRCQQRSWSVNEVASRINSRANKSEREHIFLLLALQIYRRYQQHLSRKNLIDFNVVLRRACERVRDHSQALRIRDARHGDINLDDLKHIMVDEFQDFSPAFFNLIQAFKQRIPSLKLFCVGDDWQSINSFAGSDPQYFENFETIFSGGFRLELTSNYRSQQQVVFAGNSLMEKVSGSPSHAMSPLPPRRPTKWYLSDTFVDVRSSSNRDVNDAKYLTFVSSKDRRINADRSLEIAKTLKLSCELIESHWQENDSFMILARTNRLSNHYDTLSKFQAKLLNCLDPALRGAFYSGEKTLTVQTFHKAKGSEADLVIILNAREGMTPMIHPDTELFQIFGTNLTTALAEERRLFYVAITRAKRELHIVTERRESSRYLNELRL